MSVDSDKLLTIDNLIVNKYYKLYSTDEHLGVLTKEPYIMGSGDGREKCAIFLKEGNYKYIPRWQNYDENKLNYFLLIESDKKITKN
jgi:hypothetical protein